MMRAQIDIRNLKQQKSHCHLFWKADRLSVSYEYSTRKSYEPIVARR